MRRSVAAAILETALTIVCTCSLKRSAVLSKSERTSEFKSAWNVVSWDLCWIELSLAAEKTFWT